jgi:hypothetical protein
MRIASVVMFIGLVIDALSNKACIIRGNYYDNSREFDYILPAD